jgi:hypothetical protein
VAALFAGTTPPDGPRVIGLEGLIRMKRTQRAKDYAVIGELARLLPPESEIRYTTDADRILALAEEYGSGSARAPVQAARAGAGREDVVVALARETFAFQETDRRRVDRYLDASRAYRRHLSRSDLSNLPLEEAHPLVLSLAERHLPTRLEDGPP